MRLEEYWGVGPKTREALVDEIGVERAVTAIESGDVRTLAEAGLPRGRATRILRRAIGGAGMDTLATGDARAAYKELLELAVEYAVTERAADRIRVLTPLSTQATMEERLDSVLAARDAWAALEEADQTAVLEAYNRYDDRAESTNAAVDAALALSAAGIDSGPFAAIADLNKETLERAARALSAFAGGGGASGGKTDGRVQTGADEELDRLRTALGAVEDMNANALELLEELRGDARDSAGFRDAFTDRLLRETPVTADRVREAMATDAADATDFIGETLRTLRGSLTEAVDEREQTVRAECEATLEETESAVETAVRAVDEIAFHLSLARFALAYDCTRPVFIGGEAATTDGENKTKAALAVVNARNLTVAARDGEAVQPITYALGDHSIDDVPDGRVAVLTGANSGGKTTLLETLCQVVLLASMGLPVPADRAEVTPVDALVFHRRHASFNAGVLESTLRSIVPPLSSAGRTLMLVDEFEAITEPGSAANLLHGLVNLTVDRDALGVFVTHLADDLEPLPPEARVDGIFAEGLSPDLELVVDYQPRFGTVGRSTPEFIVSRLVANASDRTERMGFETLAEAVGQEIVQRTLADARWQE